jgi:uncharacterized membrane protein YphA (DoxX/SURF4 family)
MKRLFTFLAAGVALIPSFASAHEVYVLTPDEIQKGLTTPAFSWENVILSDMHNFLFWTFIAVLTVLFVFGISIVRPLEKALTPFFDRYKKYASHITRITVGVSFLAAAYYQAAYGPELPLLAAWGAATPFVTGVLVLMGVSMIFGIFTRGAALLALFFYAVNVLFHGTYMLTYTNYLGEIIVLLLMGAHSLGHHTQFPLRFGKIEQWIRRIGHHVKPYAFLILRVCFGISLFYASFYAKFLHNDLALEVASLPLAGHMVSLGQALGFEPHFLVVGAGIIEFVIALFFILGIEIRFTSLFVMFWVSLSVWWFGEVVWPHIILLGIPLAFVIYGYDRYSIEGLLFKKRLLEPVL